MRDNKNAIQYNKSLGFELCDGQENVEHQKYILTKEKFEKKSQQILKAARKISKGDDKLNVIIEKEDFERGIGEKIEKLLITDGLKGIKLENGSKLYKLT